MCAVCIPVVSTGTQLTGISGSRGNLTSIQRCTDLTNCSTYLQTTMTYDTGGQLQTVKDPANNQTGFSYTDNFLDDDGSNPPSKGGWPSLDQLNREGVPHASPFLRSVRVLTFPDRQADPTPAILQNLHDLDFP